MRYVLILSMIFSTPGIASAKSPLDWFKPKQKPVTSEMLKNHLRNAADILLFAGNQPEVLNDWFQMYGEDSEKLGETFSQFFTIAGQLAEGKIVFHNDYGKYLTLSLRYSFKDEGCRANEGLVAYTVHREDGPNAYKVIIQLCKEWKELATEQLKTEVLIHELGHAVRGPGECYAYMFQYTAVGLATNHYYFSKNTWDALRCEEASFFRPKTVPVTEIFSQ